MSDDLAALYDRIQNGIAWLVEHDPTGAFHFWFESGLTPMSPMPAQAQERRDDWKAYFNARRVWEQLWRKMEAMEAKR